MRQAQSGAVVQMEVDVQEPSNSGIIHHRQSPPESAYEDINFFTFECCILLRIYLTGSL
jgi:hypothetical protein